MAATQANLGIRLARPEDGAACAAIYAPFVRDTWVSMETKVPDAAEMSRRISKTLPSYPWLIAEGEGDVAGYAYASRHREREGYRWSVDVTIYLAERWRGRGVGRMLYPALFDALRRQGFRSAWAGIALPNPASEGLHAAMGFERVGVYRDAAWKLGGWRDVAWWGLKLQPDEGLPAEPKPVDSGL